MANSGSGRAGDESSPLDKSSDPASHYKVAEKKSYGNMSEQHWSKTRGVRNAEALDYYRDRSKAPGVEGGGEARNYYCMDCDGVIPWDDFEGDECPHCGTEIEGSARRYFNWVEIDRVPKSDWTATAIAAGIVLLALGLLTGIVIWLFSE